MSLKLVKDTSENKSSILTGLNPEQVKAVTHIKGPLLIIAGAGSGKTRVLTHRIAYLIEQGIKPYNILALTFTNKAADEMKQRISKIVSTELSSQVWAGTFHSIFARLLRYDCSMLGYMQSFSIYDADDSLSAIKNALLQLDISQQQYSPASVRSRISWAKNQMISPATYMNSADSLTEKITARVFEAYQKRLMINNAMDFDDLLLNMISVLKNSPEVLHKYQDKFRYILVDEYQDTNRAQYVAVNLFAGKYRNIAVVGDDAQSIYRWRGADIRNILDFQMDYPDAAVIKLEQNYRSTKNILGAADSIIINNSHQLKKNLWTDNEDGELIQLLKFHDDREEGRGLIDIVQELVEKNNYSLKDFAILYRTNAQSLSFENACRSANLPYIIVGNISFYKRKEVKDTLAYLKLLVNLQDSESLRRIINEPPRGIGMTTIRHLEVYATGNNISTYQALLQPEAFDALQTRGKNAVKNFTDYIQKYIKLKSENTSIDIIIKYIEESGILQMYREINTEESLDRWNNVQQLIADLSMYFSVNEDASLEDYLQQISLVSDIDEKDTTKDLIKLMTLHSAKGLEFPVVFIAGLENGLFPIERADSSPDEIEEERRLFYVGITRAEERLFFSLAKNRWRFNEITRQSPSRFVKEVDPKYLAGRFRKEFHEGSSSDFDTFAKKKQDFKPVSKFDFFKESVQKSTTPVFDDLSHNDDYSQLPEEQIKFRVGDKVNHAHFGTGRIEQLTGIGDSRQAMVNFTTVGRKKLMLKFAKLKKIM